MVIAAASVRLTAKRPWSRGKTGKYGFQKEGPDSAQTRHDPPYEERKKKVSRQCERKSMRVLWHKNKKGRMKK